MVSDEGRILIVEDDADVRGMLGDYLSGHGFEVALCDCGQAMRACIADKLPDVVLLDLHLPGEDGLSLARFLRERYPVGIIMVTGAGDLVDRVVGLEVGADDYVTKPFDPRELRARVRSVMRRLRTREGAPDSGTARTTTVGRCVLDLDARRLLDTAGNEIPLTAMEFDLLKVFVTHPNRVLSRDELLTLTRNREWEPFDRSIDIRIARLRRKIEPDPDKPGVIRTIRGAGYMFVPAAAGL